MTKHSILGESAERRPRQAPIAGRIRPGTKVPSKKLLEDKRAKYIFEQGQKNGVPIDRIERAIIKDERTTFDFRSRPFYPINTPWFHVIESDFPSREHVDLLLKLYGEVRKGVRPDNDEPYPDEPMLYRFPVVLSSDEWLSNMPHEYRCMKGTKLTYWSEYDEHGVRYCKQWGSVEMVGEGKARRARRPSQGRPIEIRTDLDPKGKCLPDICPEYQETKCRLAGRLLFYIPGVPLGAACELRTTSYYSMNQWMGQMEEIEGVRGRIAGMARLPDGRAEPIFWVHKVWDTVSRIDLSTGEAVQTPQWLIHLHVPLDMAALAAAEERRRLEASAPAPALEHRREDEPIDDVAADDPTPSEDAEANDIHPDSIENFDDDIPF